MEGPFVCITNDWTGFFLGENFVQTIMWSWVTWSDLIMSLSDNVMLVSMQTILAEMAA